MVVKMYTVFDKVAQEAGPIQLCKNDAVATRMFENMFKDGKADPNDYWLYCVGVFETEKCEIELVNYVVPLDHNGDIEG